MGRFDIYLQPVDKVTGYRRHLGQVDQFASNRRSESLFGSSALADHVRAGEAPKIQWGLGTALGLAAGTIVGHKHGHWLLGSISGASLGTNVPALFNPETRTEAIWNLAQTHAGVFASLSMQDKPTGGFVLGYLILGILRLVYEDKA